MTRLYVVVDQSGIVVERFHEGAPHADGVVHDITAYPAIKEDDVYLDALLVLKRNEKIAAIKAEAGRRINAVYPLATGKQANMLSRKSELDEIRITGGTLTAAEQAELLTLKAAWDWVRAVRAAENNATAAVLALVDHSLIELVVPQWPTTIPPEWHG